MICFRKKLLIGHFALFSLFSLLLLGIGSKSAIPILFLYSVIAHAIAYFLSRPLKRIADALFAHRQGELFPPISTDTRGDEWDKLASTLNALNEQIRKQIADLEKERKVTEGILESLGEGVVAFDTNSKVTFANRVACHMLATPLSQMIGTSLALQTDELLKKCHDLVLQVLQTSEPAIQSWTPEKDQFLELRSSPLVHPRGVLLVLQDKTSDYKILEMGKEFIANASHELRTPITIIRGFAETLQDLPKLSREMLSEIVFKIVRTCERLDKLVKSLLTLTDVENLSESRLHSCDLVSLIENTAHLFLTAHPDVHISIKTDVPRAFVHADSDLLDLAIFNLFDNAVKYSPQPAHIECTLSQEEAAFRLTIADRGIGIPLFDLSRIFDRFYTVDKARSRKSGGAGLGLSIVKTIVEKHKGQIAATSQLGQGSSFTIALPSIECKAALHRN